METGEQMAGETGGEMSEETGEQKVSEETGQERLGKRESNELGTQQTLFGNECLMYERAHCTLILK